MSSWGPATLLQPRDRHGADPLRVVFRPPLRQAEGFLASLLRLMELDLDAPDHTTLSHRNQAVELPSFNEELRRVLAIERS